MVLSFHTQHESDVTKWLQNPESRMNTTLILQTRQLGTIPQTAYFSGEIQGKEIRTAVSWAD